MKSKDSRNLLGWLGRVVRLRDKGCVLCGAEKVQCHHLISRKIIKYKFEPMNCVCLCYNCHKGSINPASPSAHTTPWAFEERLAQVRPWQYVWWLDHRGEYPVGYKVEYGEVLDKLISAYKALGGDIRALSPSQKKFIEKAKTICTVEEMSVAMNVSKKRIRRELKNGHNG